MIPNGPPPIPIPGVSKSLLPGGQKISQNTFLTVIYDFNEKKIKKSPARGLKKLKNQLFTSKS